MTFAEELQAKADAKAIELAAELAPGYKEQLVASATKGYKRLKCQFEKTDPNLHVLGNESFISKLKEELNGVNVEFEKVFYQSPLFKGTNLGQWEYYLIFEW